MSQDMVQKDDQEESQNIFQSMGFAGGTFIGVGVVDVLGHLGPNGLVAGVIGSYFSYHYGPKCYAAMKRQYDNLDPKSKATIQAAMSRFRHTSVEEIEEKPARPKDDVQKFPDESEEQDLPSPSKRSAMIDLAPDLHIDLKDITGKAIFVCGIRRHGKTTLGARLAEQLGKHYIPLFIPDLEGDYLSLADVLPRAIIAGPSVMDEHYADYDFVGLDTPEEAFSLGYAILEQGYQVILDMTSYPALDKAVNIQVNVIRGMFKWANDHPDQRVPSCVYLDEAQRFLPQNLNDSVIQDKALVQALLKAYIDIIAIGGKRGINPVILTQRFAQVNNKIMAQSELFFLLRQTHDTDLNRCMEYADPPITAEQISKFDRGEGIYIATDGSQVVTRFHDRESDGKRSKTPQPEAAQRYATMSMTPIRAVTPEVPETPARPNLSVVRRELPALPPSPAVSPGMAVNEPTEQEGATSDRFVPREDDLLLSEVQGRLLEVWYQVNHNVEESLKQIRNERGQGLGSRYNRHASYLLEQAGLKKRRA